MSADQWASIPLLVTFPGGSQHITGEFGPHDEGEDVYPLLGGTVGEWHVTVNWEHDTPEAFADCDRIFSEHRASLTSPNERLHSVIFDHPGHEDDLMIVPIVLDGGTGYRIYLDQCEGLAGYVLVVPDLAGVTW